VLNGGSESIWLPGRAVIVRTDFMEKSMKVHTHAEMAFSYAARVALENATSANV
jgi:hypothetical protein